VALRNRIPAGRCYSHALEKDDLLSAEALEKSMGNLGKNGMLGNARTKPVSN
jgi:hypothetical protein